MFFIKKTKKYRCEGSQSLDESGGSRSSSVGAAIWEKLMALKLAIEILHKKRSEPSTPSTPSTFGKS